MAQIYKIYMNQSLLILADFAPKIKKNIQTIGLQEIDLEKLFNISSKNQQITYLFVHQDIQSIFKKLLLEVKIIYAAGGLVQNGDGDYLFIHRLGKWDLPKGKVDEGEKMREAAVREVEEECGIKVDYLGDKVATTYHTYIMRGKFVLKQTKWYNMGVNKIPKLIPQAEEDITEAVWLNKKDLKNVEENTYPLIQDILSKIK
ncbi:NUDIX hydrolase [Sphingobacterium bovistauri]|uniref:NUDIX domain-containing protein n=1 Tax=Sphingobacterium bovistauri TaxID=2781959 RepID=A0ABS7Z0G7_9SPHI|nr:NUDIX domain-containing protein [Sphingobacterium bovistauri]MCA5003665.1 NUDIX domain-containing protein [Sphingobacterium bovistauri]